MAKLVIKDPETGERLCSLVIPEGATREQIIEAGAAVLKQFRERAAAAANGGVKPAAGGRDVLCQLCRQPIPETQLAAHVEQEQQRLYLLEMQAEATRGRR